MDNIEDWVGQCNKVEEIRKELDCMCIGLSESHRNQLLLISSMYMKYAEWMYEKGKLSTR